MAPLQYSCEAHCLQLGTLDLHLHWVNGTQRDCPDHPIYQLVNSTPCEHMTALISGSIISDALLHGEGFASIGEEKD